MCGAVDPLAFSAQITERNPQCCWCGEDLTRVPNDIQILPDQHVISVMETAYRSTLLGIAVNPRVIDKATDLRFRKFVDDMLQVLTRVLSSFADPLDSSHSLTVPRRKLLTIIAELVLNAAPSANAKQCRDQYRRGLALWSALIRAIPETEGAALVQFSQSWPASLRRRFLAGLDHRREKNVGPTARFTPVPTGKPVWDFSARNSLLSPREFSARKRSRSRESGI